LSSVANRSIEAIEQHGPRAPREVPAGRTATAGGQARSRRRARRVSYVRQAGTQTFPAHAPPGGTQKEPVGQSALLVQAGLPDMLTSRQRFTPSAVPKHVQPGFVALQAPPVPTQASPLHVFGPTHAPP